MPRQGWRTALGASAISLFVSGAAVAQIASSSSLTLNAAMERALVGNATIAAARLRGPINVAGLALAGERLNPEVTVEIENEAPKQAFGVAIPVELGGKRAKRIGCTTPVTIRLCPCTASPTPFARYRSCSLWRSTSRWRSSMASTSSSSMRVTFSDRRSSE